MTRLPFIARGMLAGSLGAGVAALMVLLPIALMVIAEAGRTTVAYGVWSALQMFILSIRFAGWTAQAWLPTGLVIGACFGLLVGGRPVDRRYLLWAACAGTLLVAAALYPLIEAGFLIWQTVIFLPAGLVGGIVAALVYRRLCAPTAAYCPTEQREAASP